MAKMRSIEKMPDVQTLRQILKYNPETGDMVWNYIAPEECKPIIRRDGLGFRSVLKTGARRASIWNKNRAGRRACTVKADKYLIVSIDNVQYYAHRVAWAIHYGVWPSQQVDHINGDRQDNRIANLRDVTELENSRNVKLNYKNKTGVPGVRKESRGNKWISRINGGPRAIIKRFNTKEEAIEARRQAEIEQGYHPNHGRKPPIEES